MTLPVLVSAQPRFETVERTKQVRDEDGKTRRVKLSREMRAVAGGACALWAHPSVPGRTFRRREDAVRAASGRKVRHRGRR